MRVLVTGGRGKVGAAAAAALSQSGHEMVVTDLTRPIFERPQPGEFPYVQADLADAGEAFAVVRGFDAVVHAAAIPTPRANAAHTVFANNIQATFNILEAAIRSEVGRFVNISSETVLGHTFAERPFLPVFLPVDEEHPVRPQDPYALSKLFGEQLMDAGVARSDIACTSLRPSWVQWEGNYERNLGPLIRDWDQLTSNFWSYVDVYDLADAIRLAVECGRPGHEIFFVASPDNVGGRPLEEEVRRHYGTKVEVRNLSRPDASGVSSAKASDLLGYTPVRSWRDYLDDEGWLRPEHGKPSKGIGREV